MRPGSSSGTRTGRATARACWRPARSSTTASATSFPRPSPRPPLRYPACSTDQSRRRVTLGISVRWADAYPADYPENWIDVTGRRGCFTIVQRADPAQVVRETDESDNVGVRVVRLPYRPGRQHCPRHAGFPPPAAPAPAPTPGPTIVSPG